MPSVALAAFTCISYMIIYAFSLQKVLFCFQPEFISLCTLSSNRSLRPYDWKVLYTLSDNSLEEATQKLLSESRTFFIAISPNLF